MQSCADSRLGRFELLQELGRRLSSTTYLAQDPELGRRVVIKMLGKGPLSREKLAARVRSVSQLAHVGIARVFDLQYTEASGEPFLVMEYVEGETLESVLVKGKLSEGEALALTVELLQALAYAHASGVSHQNLKPSNLILTRDGHLKVTDFGGFCRGGVTTFTAPEQVKESGDERSDLFSVGAILYLMLSGFRPFQGNTDATIGFKLVNQQPVPVAVMDMKLAPELDVVIGRLMAKNPDERYQTAEEVRCTIAAIQNSRKMGAEILSSDEPLDSHLALLQTVGFRPTEDKPGTPGERRSKALWRIAAPLAGTCMAIATLAWFSPLLQKMPVAPVVSVHLQAPALAIEKAETSSVRTPGLNSVKRKTIATAGSEAAVPRVTAESVAVPVELREPFRECLMSIWVDKKLAYKNHIRGEKRARFLHLGTSAAEYLTMIQMPAGNHSLRVEVEGVGEKYEASGSVSASFSKQNDQKLRITAEKDHSQLELQLN
jgi:serine/threonine protein kinase